MMKNPYIAGLAAGAVAATLYLSIATGSAIGLLLFYLAPLPGLTAGFGWGVRAAAMAAVSGTIFIFSVLGIMPALAYGITLALPGILFTHFAFLYRVTGSSTDHSIEEGQNAKPHIEWYPIGNLVLIVALYGGLLSMLIILLLGSSHEAYLSKIGDELDLILKKTKEAGLLKELKPEEIVKYKQLVQSMLPASTAMLWSLLALVNMWIAAHIVRLSGLLQRPWPEFARIEIPQIISIILVGILVLSFFTPGLLGLVLSGYAGALMLAFLLLGLAVVHFLTQAYPARGLILFATYVAVIFIGWGAVVLMVLGIAEPFTELRKRSQSAPT